MSDNNKKTYSWYIFFIVLCVAVTVGCVFYSCTSAKAFDRESKGISAAYEKKSTELVRVIQEAQTDTTKLRVSIDAQVLKEMDYHQEQVRDLLNLQFERLQSERNVLEIWAASLTIVFLIFSFFSLFHTEDMMKEAREKLNKLESISSTAETKGNEIESRLNQKLNPISAKITEADTKIESIKKIIGDQEKLASKLQLIDDLTASASLQKEEREQIKLLKEQLADMSILVKALSARSSISKFKDTAPDDTPDEDDELEFATKKME